MKKSTIFVIFPFLALAVMLGLAAGVYMGIKIQMPVDGSSSSAMLQVSFESAWAQSSDAVISIVARQELQDVYLQLTPAGQLERRPGEVRVKEVGSGSGFIVAADGLAVTNRHVVENESLNYVAILADGSELSVEVLALDPFNDLALLQVDPGVLGVLPHLDFANSDELNVGQPVLAIGNALGEYSNTATSGIISALDRTIKTSSGMGRADNLIGLIQTDAAINSGNSGGPLLDLEGRVLGVNTAVSLKGDSIGFAIPSNAVQQVLDSYREHGAIVRPQLGVHYLAINSNIQKRFDLPVDYGVVLLNDERAGIPAVFPGGVAESADLRAGDIILSVNRKEIRSNHTLPNALQPYDLDDKVFLEVWREGEVFEVVVEL